MKHTILLFGLLVSILFSCKKEPIPNPSSIVELTDEFDGQLKYRTQLRLAFGKTVAKAFNQEGFAGYIIKTSKRSGNDFFDEIVFSMHKDDVVVGQRTLTQVLKASMDEKVKDLFGPNFLKKVLEDDPMVSIKLPDIFFKFQWNTLKFSPMVYVKTPEKFVDADNFYTYMAYHKSGYQTFVNAWGNEKHFCIIVKYSEDHLLVDLDNKVTHKGIPFFSMIPQAEAEWSSIKSFILGKNQTNEIKDYLFYINKRDLRNEFFRLHDAKNYFFFADNPDCIAGCGRDCAPDKSVLNNVMDSFSVVNTSGVFHYEHNELVFNENIEVQFTFFEFDKGIYSAYFSMGNRRSDFYDMEYEYNFSLEEERYEGIGCAEIPQMDVSLIDINITSEKIPIKYLYMRGWQGIDYQYDAYRLYYEDRVGNFELHDTKLSTSQDVNYPLFLSVMYECIPKIFQSDEGAVLIDFKF